MSKLRDRQEQSRGGVDDGEMIEADARELGKGDGEDGEIDASHAEAEGEKADDRAAGRGNRRGGEETEPRTRCRSWMKRAAEI